MDSITPALRGDHFLSYTYSGHCILQNLSLLQITLQLFFQSKSYHSSKNIKFHRLKFHNWDPAFCREKEYAAPVVHGKLRNEYPLLRCHDTIESKKKLLIEA